MLSNRSSSRRNNECWTFSQILLAELSEGMQLTNWAGCFTQNVHPNSTICQRPKCELGTTGLIESARLSFGGATYLFCLDIKFLEAQCLATGHRVWLPSCGDPYL